MTRLAELQQITLDGMQKLQRQFPGMFESGGCLFVGKHYAHPASRVLMLGINPGLSPSRALDVGLQTINYLLEESPGPKHQYWANARKFFNSSPSLNAAVRLATFSLCCPYRTASWTDLSPDVRAALIDASRPILNRIVRDCRPRLIIVAGVDGFRVLTETLGRSVHIDGTSSRGGDSGTYQWAAHPATFESQSLTIAQVPHFSRANSRPKLEECARWLADLNERLEAA